MVALTPTSDKDVTDALMPDAHQVAPMTDCSQTFSACADFERLRNVSAAKIMGALEGILRNH